MAKRASAFLFIQSRRHSGAFTRQPDNPAASWAGRIMPIFRLPKLFEACQNLRASLSSGPLSAREQQIVNLVIARHWNARYPWFAQVRRSLTVGIERGVIDAINAHGNPSLADAREHTCLVVARELLARKSLSDETYTAAEKTMGLESLSGAGRIDWYFFR
jgi:hypothetical protein